MDKRKIPKEVIIDAIMYRVTEVDDMIIFSEARGMWGCCDRICFHRPKYACWQVEIFPTFGQMMASHICKAYKLVCRWRGDDFGRKVKIHKEKKHE